MHWKILFLHMQIQFLPFFNLFAVKPQLCPTVPMMINSFKKCISLKKSIPIRQSRPRHKGHFDLPNFLRAFFLKQELRFDDSWRKYQDLIPGFALAAETDDFLLKLFTCFRSVSVLSFDVQTGLNPF